jgi:hypothetical protein
MALISPTIVPDLSTSDRLGGSTLDDPRGMYNAEITKIAENPELYNPNERASYLGMTFGNTISPQEYLASLESIYGPGSGWAAATTPTTKVTGTGTGAETNVAGEQAAYDDQISALDQLLGTVGAQETSGLKNLADQKSSIMSGYDTQRTQNTQARQRGLETTDAYANNNYNSLQRLLQGANAGNSSVSRELIPYLVAKSAGTRRQGVFNAAGENEQAIEQAGLDTSKEFAGRESDFLLGIRQKQQELAAQKAAAQTAKAAANGSNYATAMAAGAATRAGMGTQTAAINALLGNFTPSTKAPELKTYQVDPSQVGANQGMPSESSYYLNQLLNKKKKELV